MNPQIDSYSGLYDNGHRASTGMGEWLKARGVQRFSVAGVATDYCVKFTVLDALAEGFEVKVLTTACRGVDLSLGDSALALEEMRQSGAELH
jgi:nicotinamidase/pyrazinamidase